MINFASFGDTSIQPPGVSLRQLTAISKAHPDKVAAMTPNDIKKLVGGDLGYVNDMKTALANSVTADMPPEEISRISTLDKALAMVAEMKKIEQEVYYARLEAMEARRKKERELRSSS